MSLPETILSLGCLALFSLADLRYRVAPGAVLFFLATILMAAPPNPLKVGMVILAVGWGMAKRAPALFSLPLFFHPSTWALLLLGVGVRRGEVGRCDLLVLAGLACLYPWPVPLLAIWGVALWHRLWGWRGEGSTPAIPVMLLGLAGYLFLKAMRP